MYRVRIGMSTKKALVVGISGQDGAYLSRLLLEKGYEVVGTSRDAQAPRLENLQQLGIVDRVQLESMSPTDFRSVFEVLSKWTPDEVYNLSGQSSVAMSFSQPVEALNSIANATITLLEAIRFLGKPIRFYNAGSSECFGEVASGIANEDTPFHPRSPYAVAKVGRALDRGQLPRRLRPLRVHRDPLQPRVAAAPRALRHAQDRHRRRRDRRRPPGQAGARQHGREARLGLGAGVRRGDVEDAAARDAATTT